jgi:rubrerythrin
MELKNSKTYLNLARAYDGECQARTRYEFMSYGARQQDYVAMADLIDKIIDEEFNHARMLYTFIQTADKGTITNIDVSGGFPYKQKWNLLDNLKLAAEDETNEATKLYPEFAKVAKQEGFDDIAGLFNNLIQVETCHKKTFEQLYAQMNDGSMYKKPTAIKWKCGGCGHEETSKAAWSECPLCQAKQGAVLIQIQGQ